METDLAISFAISLLNHASEISTIVAKAQGEGRSTFTSDEWATILKQDDVSVANAQAALAKAKAEGR